MISSSIFIIGALVFTLFGSGDIQPWAKYNLKSLSTEKIINQQDTTFIITNNEDKS